MSIINENALAEMIAKAVKEQRERLEEDLTGRTIGINEFRRKYCGGKSPEWVRTFVFDRYPEVDYANGGWVESHQLDIDWNERLAK